MDGDRRRPGSGTRRWARLRALAPAAMRRGAPAACPRCGAATIRPWGRTRAGLSRLRCAACRRTFTATAGTLFDRVRRPGELLAVLEDMLSEAPGSCRALAARLGLDRMTVWRWRGRIARALGEGDAPDPDPTAVAAATLRKSRKASREWVRHERAPARFPRPDRLRWHEYPRLGLPPPGGPRYTVQVRIVADRAGRLRAEPWSPPAAAGGEPAAAAGMRARLARFLRPFRGPATRHLRGYLAWFGAWADATAGRARPLQTRW